jgi:SAM-dependent methyltransferase
MRKQHYHGKMMTTKERFEEWYAESGGDPWGCDQPIILDRLDNSLGFIQQFVGADFAGTFVELGAFDGRFTVKLAAAFPASHVIANDISEMAVNKARERAARFRNVTFNTSDLSALHLPVGAATAPVILLMMEMLYYLPHDQRGKAFTRLLSNVPDITHVFISGPIQGDDYLNEKWLREVFGENRFGLLGGYASSTRPTPSANLSLGNATAFCRSSPKYVLAGLCISSKRCGSIIWSAAGWP